MQVLYMLATVVSLDYLHDAWFYWTHRLLHWQPLYRKVHYIHHECASFLQGSACQPNSVLLHLALTATKYVGYPA